MNCKNCGSAIEEGSKFCPSCGANIESVQVENTAPVDQVTSVEQVTVVEPTVQAAPTESVETVAPTVEAQSAPAQETTGAKEVPTETPVVQTQNITPTVNNEPAKKGGNKALIITIISILSVGLLVGLGFLVKNLISSGDANFIKNTTWICEDNSEMVFGDDRLTWYEKPSVHDDNYYSGLYNVYMGKDAVEFVTTSLSEYGITKDELQQLFDRNEEYNESNFIVFEINYDKYVLNGEDKVITRSLVPMYGFVLKNNTYLDLANMNTGTYVSFTKK